MTRFVIDASIAIKWVVSEDGSDDAVALLAAAPFAAPELFAAECANILWKKARASELTAEEALLAAKLIERADIELHPMRALIEPATRLAIELDHPAYDCAYLTLAIDNDWTFVTADKHLLNKLRGNAESPYGEALLSLTEAAVRVRL